MTEIQEAFEKWANEKSGYSYSLERWNEAWVSNGPRHYASMVVENDFAIFRAGYLAGEKKGE